MTGIRFGVQFLPQEVSWDQWRDAWVRADQLGFDSLWSYDHVHAPRGAPPRPCFEGWMGMAALAALTRQAEVGMLVSAVMFRNPALLVKMATTVDHVTGGKSILGLGAGWHVNEHQAYGWGFPRAGERVSRPPAAPHGAPALGDGPPGGPATDHGPNKRSRSLMPCGTGRRASRQASRAPTIGSRRPIAIRPRFGSRTRRSWSPEVAPASSGSWRATPTCGTAGHR